MALSPELKRMVSEAKTAVNTLTVEDFTALIDHRKDAVNAALAEYTDAVDGLRAIVHMIPPDEPGVADFGEDREVITRLVKATRDFKRINDTAGNT